MEKENTINQKFQEWTRAGQKFLSCCEKHIGKKYIPILTLCFSVSFPIFKFIFRKFYTLSLEGYFSYFHVPFVELQPSSEKILTVILTVVFILLLVAISFKISFWVEKRQKNLVLKFLTLFFYILFTTIFYLFFCCFSLVPIIPFLSFPSF